MQILEHECFCKKRGVEMYIKITSQMSTGNGLDPHKWYHYQGYYLILQEKRTQVNGYHDRDTYYQARLLACGRGDVSTPSFGSHPNPISTRGADYAHPIIVSTPSFESHRRACTKATRLLQNFNDCENIYFVRIQTWSSGFCVWC